MGSRSANKMDDFDNDKLNELKEVLIKKKSDGELSEVEQQQLDELLIEEQSIKDVSNLTVDDEQTNEKSTNQFEKYKSNSDDNHKPNSDDKRDKSKKQGKQQKKKPESSESIVINCAIACNVSGFGSRVLNSNKWYIDCGATDHCSNQLNGCIDFNPNNEIVIQTAGNQNMMASGTGTYQYLTTNGVNMRMHNVVYCPNLAASFLSLFTLEEKGFTYKGGNGEMQLFHNDKLILTAKKMDNRMYEAEFIIDENNVNHNTNSLELVKLNQIKVKGLPDDQRDSIVRWHKTLGHLNLADILRLSDRLNINAKTKI